MTPQKNRAALLAVISFLCISCSDTKEFQTTIVEESGNFRVSIDGRPFTEIVYGEQKPFLYPVVGPTGIGMTRRFPMEENVPGESQDHPWQSSVYYAHGSVNGIDFWNERTEQHAAARIELLQVESIENLEDGTARFVATHSWNHRGKTLMTDRTEIVFSGDRTSRMIDYTITLEAAESDVELGDTKEGCMAVRMHPRFRVKDQGARARNSEGHTGRELWGKSAKWVCYTNEFDGDVLSIAMFDHPDNFRHPTPWHARDYGLLAANAFGLSHFSGDKDASGEITLRQGESMTFSYRLLFLEGDPSPADLEQRFREWATP